MFKTRKKLIWIIIAILLLIGLNKSCASSKEEKRLATEKQQQEQKDKKEREERERREKEEKEKVEREKKEAEEKAKKEQEKKEAEEKAKQEQKVTNDINAASPASSNNTTSNTNSSNKEHVSNAPTTNISFRSCKEAKAAGYSNMRRGEPGYSPHLDRDGDGIACEK